MTRHAPLREIARLFIGLAACALLSCGGGDGGSSGDDPFANLRVFDSSSPYASKLLECIRIETPDQSCPISDLPHIGRRAADPSIDEIMDHVVVSHDWMGHRFREALQNLPPDVRVLLRAVTAIVIDDDINPSFYWAANGAIHLDPYYLWQTNPEKATISLEEDYRSHFGAELAFVSFSRYVRNDDYAWMYYSLTGPEERTVADLVEPFAALLYHELAHANDYFPQGEITGIDPTRTLAEAAARPTYERVSSALFAADPLTSTTLMGIAAVRFHGAAATSAQKNVTAHQAALLFGADSANDDYSYSSVGEDLAMLFEETMLRHHYDLDRDVGFLPRPAVVSGCDSYVVSWGVRNRLGDADVKARAVFASDRLLPSLDLTAFYAGLPLPGALRAGVGWCNSVVLAPPTPGRSKPQALGHERPLRNPRGYE